MSEAGIIELVTIIVPTAATVISTLVQNRMSRRHSAKQSILQMIMEDQLNWSLFKKLPTNYRDISHEYDEYHKNGGNGEVTRRLNDYLAWRESIQNSISKEETK